MRVVNKLSIIIPAFNEESTIHAILNKIKAVTLINEIGKEIIIIDDCSTDNTQLYVNEFMKENADLEIQLLRHHTNRGKGAAIHTGIEKAVGDYLIIQDADMEYNPEEYNILLQPVVDGFADVVYGTRFCGGRPRRIHFFWHIIANKFLTFLSNMLTNLSLSDMETCYKLFNTNIIRGFTLYEKGFGFEPEVTAKVAKLNNVKIYEIGISYYGRTYEEGKRINWKDGLRAIYCIFKYNLFSK